MKDPFSMDALLENLQSLPTLPEVAMKVLQMTANPDVDLQKLETLLSNDPSLTAKILRVANSSYYGLSRQVTTLKMALVVLGLEETARLIRAITFLNTFPSVKVENVFDYGRFWLHSITVAEIVRGLGSRLKLPEASEASTGALLHDMGHLVLASFFEDDFIEIVNLSRQRHISWNAAESELIGFDHAEIGAILCKRWNLPESIRQVVLFHHRPQQAEKHLASVYLGYLANRIACQYGIEVAQDLVPVPIIEDPVWQGLFRLVPAHNSILPADLVANSEEDVKRGEDLHSLLVG